VNPSPNTRQTPSLALGQLEPAFACPRRLARLLDPELTPARGKEPSFRLPGAINDALMVAHRLAEDREVMVTQTLDATPPPHLGTEEAKLFSIAIGHYDEAFGEDPAVLDRRAGEFLKRPAADPRYELSGKLDLVFTPKAAAPPEGALLEVRRIVLREHTVSRSTTASWRDIGTAALLRIRKPGDDDNQPILRIETLWAAGTAKIITTYVRAGDLDLLRDRLTLAVNAATDTPEQAIPGWWCPTCRFAHRCPAIAQDSAEQLLSRFNDEDSEPGQGSEREPEFPSESETEPKIESESAPESETGFEQL
jgi:hypothetical protein